MTITGIIVSGPELRYTTSGKAVCNLKLDCQDKEIVRVVAWEKVAERVAEQFNTGDEITVSGRFKSRQWTDRQGAPHTVEEFVLYD